MRHLDAQDFRSNLKSSFPVSYGSQQGWMFLLTEMEDFANEHGSADQVEEAVAAFREKFKVIDVPRASLLSLY